MSVQPTQYFTETRPTATESETALWAERYTFEYRAHALPQRDMRSARSRANKLAEDHRKRARERQEAAERLAARHAAERNAAMARRRRAAAQKEQLRRQASASAMAKAMAEAQKAKAAAEARSAADEAKSREWMRRVLETEEASRKVDMEKAAAAARAKTAHARWQAFRDTSAGMFDGDAFLCDSDDEEEEEEEAADADAGAPQAAVQEWVTEEILQSRELKAAERDECVKRVLEKGTRTLKAALGLEERASSDKVVANARKQLRLLHPDFGINLALQGTKQHKRIELAFKKLNGLKLIDGT